MAKLSLSAIQTDGGTQTRAAINPDTVKDYAEAIEAGDTLPPVTVYHDGETYWLADGFHRVSAYKKQGAIEIEADVRQGARRDAVLHSVGANATHGLRRTNDDKRRAVTVLLEDAEWREWSDREIGRRAGVSNRFVGNMRGELTVNRSQSEATSHETKSDIRKGGDGRTINTAKIGKPVVSLETTETVSEPPKPAVSEYSQPRHIKTYSPPPLPDTPEEDEPWPFDESSEDEAALVEPDSQSDYILPDDAPLHVVEAASQPVPKETLYTRQQDFKKEARYDEAVKIADALNVLARTDLAELIYGPSGVFLGAPNLFRLVTTYGQKENPNETPTITVLN